MMKKLLFPLVMTTFGLCLTLQASHAMKRDGDDLENESKRLKICEPNPQEKEKEREALHESPFYHLTDDINYFIVDTLLSGQSCWSLRPVSHYWKRITDERTTHIDLSSVSFFVPSEKRRFPNNDKILQNDGGDTFIF